MSTWLYQLNQKFWGPELYRLEIWEGEPWSWTVGQISGEGQKPEAGDTLVTFYAKSDGPDPGFYGWAVIQEWKKEPTKEAPSQLRFRPVTPSDALKMRPWWDKEADALADAIRGEMKQRTLWLVPDEQAKQIRRGMMGWVAGKALNDE